MTRDGKWKKSSLSFKTNLWSLLLFMRGFACYHVTTGYLWRFQLLVTLFDFCFFPAALLEWPLGNNDFKTASSYIAWPLQERFPVFYDYIPSAFILVRDKKNLNCGSDIQVAKTGTQKLSISSKIQPLSMPLYWVYHLWYSTFLWKLIYSIYLISLSANHMHQPKTGFSSPANFSMCQNLETKSKSTAFYILKVWC